MERHPNKIEKVLSPEKQELLRLEAEGKYVFHGTGEDLEELEPRQATDTVRGPDGEPAVFASNKADYAIFMAIFNKNNFPHGTHTKSGATFKDDGSYVLNFEVTRETFNQLSESASGWVYVFNKGDFQPREKHTVEYVSAVASKPVFKIKVFAKDLPSDIEVFQE